MADILTLIQFIFLPLVFTAVSLSTTLNLPDGDQLTHQRVYLA